MNIAGVKATNPSGRHHGKQGQRQAQDEAGSGPGRGRHLDERLSLYFLFYLLLYFHLVVQVVSVGVSLGRGSMKADFLVIKKRGWGNKEEGTWLKHALVESILHLLKLET